MIQQSSKVQGKIIATESTSHLFAGVKVSFAKWLSAGHVKEYLCKDYVSCMDKVSTDLLQRKIALMDLWQITNSEEFKSIYNKAINDKLFRVTDKKTYATFVQVGQLYLEFLENSPTMSQISAITHKLQGVPVSSLTIREAAIRVLEIEQRGMTVHEIFEKIIAGGLYVFGARNPESVLRIEIERACENTNYSIRATENYFRFEQEGKEAKVYFLL